MSQIRYDPLRDEYVVIAPERLHRPMVCSALADDSETVRRCPFCEGNESLTPPEIYALREDGKPNGPGWRTRVVPNLYKAVMIEVPWQSAVDGPYVRWEGFGAHEIVIDTPRHLARMDHWESAEYLDWLRTLRYRVNDLRNDIRLVHFSLFKNHGAGAGATQTHPHTQIIALPMVPMEAMRRYERAHGWWREHRHTLFDAIIDEEERKRERIVARTDRWLAYAPYASAFAFEVAILARWEGAMSLCDCDDGALEELARLFKDIVTALYRQLGDFDFNILFENPPLNHASQVEGLYGDLPACWRFHLRIVPRLFGLAGFELGSGSAINPVPPEDAARYLRKVLP